MKTTIEIAAPLLDQAKRTASQEDSTLRALVEEGLRLALARRQGAPSRFRLKPLKTQGGGLRPEFEGAGWEKILDAIYPENQK
jgi:hypothetical protein